MQKLVYLYGAGGHAKVIIELLEAEGRVIGGLFDDRLQSPVFLGYPVSLWREGALPDAGMIVSIGHNATRRKIALKIGGPFAKTRHQNSFVSPRADWGEGTVVMSGVSIHSGARIGVHSIVNTHASVDHDCSVGDFAHIAPHAVLCGHVTVGEGTLIGAGAVITPGVKIGNWAVIGAGSVVRRDVPDCATVAGNPARIFFTNGPPGEKIP
jgi:acetyltransferase EpsM